jgi:hypothetical protein
VQWGAYEWIMYELGHGRHRLSAAGSTEIMSNEIAS